MIWFVAVAREVPKVSVRRENRCLQSRAKRQRDGEEQLTPQNTDIASRWPGIDSQKETGKVMGTSPR